MAVKTYSFEHVPTLQKMYRDNTYMRAVTGPFGSGKSSFCGPVEIIHRATDQMPDEDGVRKTRWAAVRNSYPQLIDTTIPTFMEWAGELGDYKVSTHDFTFTKLQADDGSPVQCTVHFRPLDKPQDIKNLLSLELTGAWFNEVRECPKKIVDTMRGRVGRYPKRNPKTNFGPTWSGIWMDTNPPDTDHWFYKLFEEEKPAACKTCRTELGGLVLMTRDAEKSQYCPRCGGKDVLPLTSIHHQPSGLSPEAENLPALDPNYYTLLSAGMDAEFIRVYVHGQYGYVRDGRPVYQNYDDSKHLSPKKLVCRPGYPIILSFDNTGLTQACVICQLLPWGTLNVCHEFLVENIGTRRLGRDIVKPFLMSHYAGAEIVITGDPMGVRRSDTDERNSYQELHEIFRVLPIPAHSNSFTARFNAVDALLMKFLGKDYGFALQLSTEVPLLRRGFLGEYRMRRLQVVGKEMYTDRPEKNLIANLHDALQYAAMYVDYGISTNQINKAAIQEGRAIDATSSWGAFV